MDIPQPTEHPRDVWRRERMDLEHFLGYKAQTHVYWCETEVEGRICILYKLRTLKILNSKDEFLFGTIMEKTHPNFANWRDFCGCPECSARKSAAIMNCRDTLLNTEHLISYIMFPAEREKQFVQYISFGENSFNGEVNLAEEGKIVRGRDTELSQGHKVFEIHKVLVKFLSEVGLSLASPREISLLNYLGGFPASNDYKSVMAELVRREKQEGEIVKGQAFDGKSHVKKNDGALLRKDDSTMRALSITLSPWIQASLKHRSSIDIVMQRMAKYLKVTKIVASLRRIVVEYYADFGTLALLKEANHRRKGSKSRSRSRSKGKRGSRKPNHSKRNAFGDENE
eukprot:jgi/Bigna1/66173/fgenesh1_pg.1_\